MPGIFPYCVTLTIIASFFVGSCLYASGMVKDLQIELQCLDQTNPKGMWSTYVNEIRFHSEILK